MYSLMIKFDAFTQKLLLKFKASFLLYLYKKYIPERTAVTAAVYLCFNRLHVTLAWLGKKFLMPERLYKKTKHLENVFLSITNALRTTIGASSNYFRELLRVSKFQTKNLFFSFPLPGRSA